ncbi:MAG: arsenite methyltransferase [Syntrophaceae bacterium]
MGQEEIKKAVRDRYGKIANNSGLYCFPSPSCCGGENAVEKIGRGIGYSSEDLQSVPERANLGLGCGNPVALASLKEGETVVDFGSGAGFDCFLAANQVGKNGRVIGVDMTPEMLDKARENARKDGYGHVEFRLGEIENLPVADNSADIIISNCVIILSPDKKRVFQEAFRVLKSGGRLVVSDIVLLRELPEAVRNSIEVYVGCLAGAVMKDNYINAVKEAGFQDVKIVGEKSFTLKELAGHPEAAFNRKISGEILAVSFASINVSAIKPEMGVRNVQ